MKLNEYQNNAMKTFLIDPSYNIAWIYTTMGLTGEAGEVANKLKKVLRGDYKLEEIKQEVADELGDVLWYVAVLGEVLGYDLETIAQKNLIKLYDRKKRGVIQGSGDKR